MLSSPTTNCFFTGEQEDESVTCAGIFLLVLEVVTVWGKVSGRELNSEEKENICASLAIHLLKHLIELGLGLGLGLVTTTLIKFSIDSPGVKF